MVTVKQAETVRIEALTPEAVRSLLDPPEPPCLSVYLPTHRTVPDSLTDRPSRPRFHTVPLVRAVTALERFHVLAMTSRAARVWSGCVWHDPRGGVADRLDAVPLAVIPGEAAVDTLSRADAVSEEPVEPHRVRHTAGGSGAGTAVVHGGFGSRRDGIDRDTEIFLRHVDLLVLEQVSRRDDLPLVLVAPARLAAVFRGLSANPLLLDEGVDLDPQRVAAAELAAAVVPVFTRARSARVAREVRAFEQARTHGRGADDLVAVARAAVAGRVATLIVEADRLETGRFDRRTGALELDGRAVVDLSRTGDEPAMDREDVLGAVTETVFGKGGAVVTLPRVEMPTQSGVAAIYRYA